MVIIYCTFLFFLMMSLSVRVVHKHPILRNMTFYDLFMNGQTIVIMSNKNLKLIRKSHPTCCLFINITNNGMNVKSFPVGDAKVLHLNTGET